MLVHFLADFALQTHWQAVNKSSNSDALFQHTITYGLCILILGFGLLNGGDAVIFGLVNFAIHSGVDAITSKLTKFFFDKKDYHNGFVVVGADQFIHVATLVGTYLMLV